MSQSQWRLWLADAKTELKEWPRKPLLVWVGCLLGSLLFAYIAFTAYKNSQQLLVDSASGAQNLSQNAAANSPSNDAATTTANEPQELLILDSPEQPDNQNLKRLSESALTLHSRLQTGSESETSYASRAGRVAGLAVAMRQSQLTNSEASFWRPISEAIAALERGVRLGDIANGPAVGLITELRSRYVDLRTVSGSVDDSASDAPVAAATAAESVQAVEGQNNNNIEAEDLAAHSLPLSLRLLPWLSLLLPLGCLLFGVRALLNRMQRRYVADPKKGYTHIAATEQVQAMTATSIPENRHVAERKTQAAILQLLDEMEPLSEGDLTYEASVTEDLTGALADSFNHAVHELRRLVKQINRSTVMVRSAVTESRERTLLMARQGAVQAREVSRTNAQLEGMQADVVSLSSTSHQVAEYAQKVAKRTQQAAKSVTETRDALAAMRARADVAERSMSRLVSSTKGIESRLADIKTAVKRTDLLALNSTIHAASTPELVLDSTGSFAAGNNETFSELAMDVSSLAGELKSATNDIDQLSDVIRDEANDSLHAVRETVAQVKMSEALSQEAKQHLDDIAQAAQALGSAVTDISQRTALQAQGVTDITNTTNVINNITHDTATALTQAVQDLQNLENMSNSLEASVHGFRLPEEQVN